MQLTIDQVLIGFLFICFVNILLNRLEHLDNTSQQKPKAKECSTESINNQIFAYQTSVLNQTK